MSTTVLWRRPLDPERRAAAAGSIWKALGAGRRGLKGERQAPGLGPEGPLETGRATVSGDRPSGPWGWRMAVFPGFAQSCPPCPAPTPTSQGPLRPLPFARDPPPWRPLPRGLPPNPVSVSAPRVVHQPPEFPHPGPPLPITPLLCRPSPPWALCPPTAPVLPEHGLGQVALGSNPRLSQLRVL